MKLNRINKLVTCTLLSICSSYSYGQNENADFTLRCKVKIDYSDSTGYKKIDNEEIYVEVSELISPKYKSIFIKSSSETVNNISISVPPPPKLITDGYTIKNQDLSDENKYEFTSNIYSPKNANTNLMIYLNRNTGKIIVTSEYTLKNGFITQTTVGGNCEKIDKTKKKF